MGRLQLLPARRIASSDATDHHVGGGGEKDFVPAGGGVLPMSILGQDWKQIVD